MPDLSAFERRPGFKCGIGCLLDEGAVEELADALKEDWTSAAVSRWLHSLGHPVKQHTIDRHRRGDCNCG